MGTGYSPPTIMRYRLSVGATLVALVIFGPQAQGQLSDPVFDLQASNGRGSGSYSAMFDEGTWDPNSQTFTWTLSAPVDICDDTSGAWIATLLNAHLFVRATQLYEIELNIGVISGPAETAFVIASPLVYFPTVPADAAVARAIASFTLTDAQGDGACLRGLGAVGAGAFRSYYNGYLSDGTLFTHLVGLVCISSGGTATVTQFDPGFGFRPIYEDFSDMSTEIAFTLTPNDVAFATTAASMPEANECLGDINGDGFRDVLDLGELLAVYGTRLGDPDYNVAADLDKDGSVGIADLAELLAVYGEPCP